MKRTALLASVLLLLLLRRRYIAWRHWVYLLLGLPHQEDAEVAASIRRVRELGATPVLALYSPIPGTALWPEALAASPYDLEDEPLYHNNSLFPCWPTFSWERYTHLKRLAQGSEV